MYPVGFKDGIFKSPKANISIAATAAIIAIKAFFLPFLRLLLLGNSTS